MIAPHIDEHSGLKGLVRSKVDIYFVAMNWSRGLVLVPVAALLLACSRGGSSSFSSSSLGDPVSEPGLFAYQAPKGWDTETPPDSDYPTCSGPAEAGGAKPTMTVSEEGYQSVDDYVKSTTASLAGADATGKLVDKGSFVTDAGVTGTRLVIKDETTSPISETVSYVFPAKSGLLLVIKGACLADDDAQYRPQFDASMKSLVLDSN